MTPPAPGRRGADTVEAPTARGAEAPDIGAGKGPGAEAEAGTAVPGPGGGPDVASPDTRPAAPGRWLTWGAILLTLVPLVVSAVVLIASAGDVHPVGDLALTELQTRDVGRYSILLGPYSRDGWYHPGPAMFYVLAVPYRLAGGSPVGLLLGALAINAGSIAAMAAIARRRGGTAAMLLTLVASGLLIRSMGWDVLTTPWNPYITVLPYGVLVYLVWSLLCGDRWALPLATLVTAFLMQTHVGYAVLSLPLLVVGAVGLAVAERRSGRPLRALGPAAGLAALLGVVAWLPPLVDQITNDPGNLRAIVRWFRAAEGRSRTLAEGWAVVSAQFSAAPEWITGHERLTPLQEPTYLYHRLVPVLLVPLLVAAVAAWRRPGAGVERRLFVAWAAASACGIVGVARTADLVYAYRLYWAWVLGGIGAVAAVWVAWTALTRWRPSVERRVLVPSAVAALGVLAVASSVGAVDAGDPQDETSDTMAAILPDVLDALPPGDGDVVVEGPGFWESVYRTGLVAALERRGIEARVVHDAALGRHREHRDGDPVRVTLRVLTDANVHPVLNDPAWELVAYEGTVPLDELAEVFDRAAEIQAQLARGDITADEAMTRTAAIGPTGTGVAVFRATGAGS
jgi:hypothetical protein